MHISAAFGEKGSQRVSNLLDSGGILKDLFCLTNIVGHSSPIRRHACRRTGEYTTIIQSATGEVTKDIFLTK